MNIKIPAPTTKIIPRSVLKVGMSLNKKYPIITDHIINEYSNIEVIEVENEVQALNIQVKATEARIPITIIYFHVNVGLENQSRKINCIVGLSNLLNCPEPDKKKTAKQIETVRIQK